MSLEKDVNELKEIVYGNMAVYEPPVAVGITRVTSPAWLLDNQTKAVCDGHTVVLVAGISVTNDMPVGQYIKIAQLDLPSALVTNSLSMHPCATSGSLLFNLKEDGAVEVYRYSTAGTVAGWCRGTLTGLLSG